MFKIIFKDSKNYDRFKWFALIVMPLLVTLLNGLVDIWKIPYGTQIVGTVSLLSAFLGGLVVKSANDYNKLPADQK